MNVFALLHTSIVQRIGRNTSRYRVQLQSIAVEYTSELTAGHLKETQLTHMREGQEVTVVADAYPDVQFRGRISTIAPATKAEFAILPAQNASGNWVKVVQRVPVLISLDSPPDGQTPLRAGMTVSARVDTGHVRSLSALR